MELKVGSQIHRFCTPQVMGIVNITPDSFYAKSRYTATDKVFNIIEQMLKEGAGMIDLGAASSRPGAAILPALAEWKRLSPMLRALRIRFPNLLVSIDTVNSVIVEQAFDLIGPFIINDISSGEDDPHMFSIAAQLHLPLIAMHKKGTPQTMYQYTDYENIVVDVHNYFASVLERAREAGVP